MNFRDAVAAFFSMENGWRVVTKSTGIVPHLERAPRAFPYFPVIEFFPICQNLTPWDLSRRNAAVYFLIALRFRVSKKDYSSCPVDTASIECLMLRNSLVFDLDCF